jgi:hypothetical protein
MRVNIASQGIDVFAYRDSPGNNEHAKSLANGICYNAPLSVAERFHAK